MALNVEAQKLCVYEINDFEKELDEDACGHEYKEEKKDSDTDDEEIKDTLKGPTLVALKTKQFLEGIQEKSLGRGILLMQHTDVISER